MPRYFFNICGGQDVFDTVGTELAGIREIRFHMIATATAMIEDVDSEFRNNGEWEMEAVDERGRIVCTMTFAITKGVK